MKNYQRVIPRDLFNEAKLLKCIGQLSLKILDNQAPKGLIIEESGEPFDICLNDDAQLYIRNYDISIKGRYPHFCTVYNSKDNYPLYCSLYDTEEVLVFDEKGDFTKEFKAFCKKIRREN